MNEMPMHDQSEQDKQAESRIGSDNELLEGGAHVIHGALKITAEQQNAIEQERQEMLERSRNTIAESADSQGGPETRNREVTLADITEHFLVAPKRSLTPFELEVVMLGIDAADHGANGRKQPSPAEPVGDFTKSVTEFMAHVARIDKPPAVAEAHGQIQRWEANINTVAQHVIGEDLHLPSTSVPQENWAFRVKGGNELTQLERRAATLMVDGFREGHAMIAAEGDRAYLKALDTFLLQLGRAFGRNVPLDRQKGSGMSNAQAWIENFRATAKASNGIQDDNKAA